MAVNGWDGVLISVHLTGFAETICIDEEVNTSNAWYVILFTGTHKN